MLIEYSIENWMSFKDHADFSMLASRELQHKQRIAYIPKYKMGVLPIAAIYGGNASGKSNFFKALFFARDFIARGLQSDSFIPIDTFRLDTQKMDDPSRFMFKILVSESMYEFSFVITRKNIVEEKLVQLFATSQKTLYHRTVNKEAIFDKSLEDNQALKFAFKGTRDNQLFLTNSVSQKIEIFKPIHDWFRHQLILISPNALFNTVEQFLDESNFLHAPMNKLLSQLDTGIVTLGGKEVALDTLILSEPMKMQIMQLPEGAVRSWVGPRNERLIVTRKNGKLVAKKLISYHKTMRGAPVEFDISQDSDGTQRVIDLLPAIIDASSSTSNKTYIIDEIDRSLHTLLSRHLIEMYLESCSNKTRAQLIFTTHDTLLMDQDLLRRDEMWITERNEVGASVLYSFSEYKDVRYDKDIRKSYLQGKLGGVPRFLFSHTQE